MKATLPLAALFVASTIASAAAQQGGTEGCPDCGSKDLLIRQLQTEIAALKGEPTAAPVATVTPIREAASPGSLTYTVQPGDGLMKIARKHHCKVGDLAAANGMTLDSVIHPGQVLKLPASAGSVPPKAAVVEAPAKPKTYTIQDGDTYYSLSRRMKIPLDELMAANPKAKATHLYSGRVINLPGTAGPQEAPEVREGPAIQEQAGESVADATPQPEPKKIVSVTVVEEITYGDFAKQHGTKVERLNSLNGFDLTSATILARGSELYVPTSPPTSVPTQTGPLPRGSSVIAQP